MKTRLSYIMDLKTSLVAKSKALTEIRLRRCILLTLALYRRRRQEDC